MLALHPPRLRPELLRANVLLCFQVTNYDSATGLPLIQLWNLTGDEVGILTYLFFSTLLRYMMMQTFYCWLGTC